MCMVGFNMWRLVVSIDPLAVFRVISGRKHETEYTYPVSLEMCCGEMFVCYSKSWISTQHNPLPRTA